MKTHVNILLGIVVLAALFNPASVAAQDFSCLSVSEIPLTECQALVALYDSTNGAGWTNQTNWLVTYTPSNWYGVTVTNGHVTDLTLTEFTGTDFTGNNLTGTLPPELGNLSYLTELNLTGNQLTGSIPSSLSNLTNLSNLFLCSNNLSGPIPPELGSMWRLFQLCLNDNQLTGSIPSQLQGLVNLRSLSLGNNQLSGSIPPELGLLYRRLFTLGLSNNQLSGSIPVELGDLTGLWMLNLSGNQLTGSIPVELSNLVNLEYLELDNNLLAGTIPLNLIKLTSLETFTYNQTSLCEPNNPDFFAWKATVTNWSGTGEICSTPLYSVSGQVTDENGQPLTGINILCNGQYYDKAVTTEADGTYLCDNLPQDMYLIEHPDTEIQAGVEVVNLQPSVYGWYWLFQDRVQQNFRAISFNGTYYGVVKDSQTNIPIANSTIKLGGAQPVVTGSTGQYSISAMGGDYLLTISAPGYITQKSVVTVQTALSTEKNVSLIPFPTNVYRLPYTAGSTQLCTQGNNTSFSHTGVGKYAFDFGDSYNVNNASIDLSTVVAAREGKVMKIKTDGVPAGLTYGCGSKGNYVLIKHPDGRASLYLHLKSVAVNVGEWVASGQPIGVAGNTGCSTGPHLHFQLEEYIYGRWWTQSVPVSFYDVTQNYRWDFNQRKYVVVSANTGIPVKSYSYKSGNLYPLSILGPNPAIIEAAIEADITAPEGSAVFQLTGTPNYKVRLAAFDYESENLEMRVARSLEALELTPWIQFAEILDWDYPMIYVQYRDDVGNVSVTYSASVESVGYEQPILDFSINPVACTYQDIGLNNQTTPYCEQCSWLWEFGDGQSSTEMEPYFDDTWEGGFAGYSNPGEYLISMTMSTALGQYTNTKTIQVLPTPNNGVVINRSALTVDVSAVEASAQDWIWDFGDGTIEHGRKVSHTYNSLDDLPPYITLQVVSENGCENRNYFEIPNGVSVFLPVITR